MEKITHLGSQHFSIPVMLIWPLFCPFLFNDTSERLHSSRSSRLIYPNAALSWWLHPLVHKQIEASTGNFLNFPSPNHHADVYLHPCPSCVLSLLLILPPHSQTSQTDVHMFCLHLHNCSLILDPFQTAFCPLCDTSTALAELMKDHLVGILQSSSYSLANSSSAWASNGGGLQIIPWLPFFPALQPELSS